MGNIPGQMNIFDMTLPEFKITSPVRLVELFAGIGAQSMALRDLGVDFEHYRAVEFDRFAAASYNAVHGTGFKTTDIRSVSGADLGIRDTDRYCYIMTYSFPCQDLSVAGRQKGMTKGSGTRSGLLWEVERLLNECEELPQVLLMENVPQVHSKANMPDFQKWINFLEGKGYSNHWKDLNAKDYGVAQNRKRCFMVSLLGKWNYKFPQPVPLEWKLKDYLEDEVDTKYYINTGKAQKLIQTAIDKGILQGCVGNVNPSGNGINGNVYAGNLSPAITTNKGEGAKICVDLSLNNPGKKTVSNCITAGDRNISKRRGQGNGVVEPVGTVYTEASDNYQRGICPVARTAKAEKHDLALVEMEVKQLGNMDADRENIPCKLDKSTNAEKGKFASFENSMIRDVGCKISGTITARYHKGICANNDNMCIVAMRGRNPDNPSDRTAGSQTEQRLEPNSLGICNTLTSMQKDNMVLENMPISYGLKIPAKQIDVGMCVTARYHKGFSNYNPENAVVNRYRIRRLTPLECWRLMGFPDADYLKAEKVNSSTQLYKQAGNSIVRNVLMAVFGQMLPGKEHLYREL